MDESIVYVAKIIKPHGLKGEVNVFPLTDFMDRFEKGQTLLLKTDQSRTLAKLLIESSSIGPKAVRVKFKGVDDRNQAEAIAGSFLAVFESDRHELEEGSFWLDQIIGLDVFTLSNEKVGQVVEVLQSQANDIYVVASDSKRFLIPAVKEIINSIDPGKGRVIIDPPDGLLE